MNSGNVLSISYERITGYEDVELDTTNCEQYGYASVQKEIDGVTYTLFYLKNNSSDEVASYEIIDGVAVTIIQNPLYKEYSYVSPPCSKFKINSADVDKEGSGRNETTGEMIRERLGKYISIDIAWDLIPNSVTYNNWYKILDHLPPYFNVELLMPSGEIVTKKMYRGDLETELYLFYKNRQLWKGLSTTFIQVNIDEYDETYDPDVTLEQETIYDGQDIVVNKQVGDITITKTIKDWQLNMYIANGWSI